jgi:hypothetical protein
LLTLALIMSPTDVAAYELSIAVQTGDSVGGRVITGSDGELPGPKMNNRGEFAFSAGLDGVQAWSVLTNTGKVLLEPGQIIDGHTTNGVSDENFAFGINDAGQVVFTEIVGLGGTIMLDNTPVVRPDSQISGVDISGVSAIGGVYYDIPINDQGQILFEARHGQNTHALFTLDALIASVGDVFDTGNGGSAAIQRFNSGEISNSGMVAYSAGLDDGLATPESQFSAIVVDGSVVVQPGDILSGRELSHVGNVFAIDDSDTIVFEAWFQTGEHAVFRGDELLATLPGEFTIDGETFAALPDHRVWASESGQIVFTRLKTGTRDVGVFTPDGLVAKVGDEVDGKTISRIHPYGHPTITNRGDIAFRASFDDGTFGIVIATVPEPASVHLVLLAGIVGLQCSRRRKGSS